MWAPPKVLIELAARWQTSRTLGRLRRTGTAVPEQDEALRSLIASLSKTALGRQHGLSVQLTYEQFRERVTPRMWSQFAPYIERMRDGEADVLWPGRCDTFAFTAGTSKGSPRPLPWTDALGAHFRNAALQSLLHYTARVGHTRVLQGRHVYLGSDRALADYGGQAHWGDASALLLRDMSPWVTKHLYEPATVDAANGAAEPPSSSLTPPSRSERVTLAAGLPHALLWWAEAAHATASTHSGGSRSAGPAWPKLECVVHTGTLASPYLEELRQLVGPRARFHDVYAATEAGIAVQEMDGSADLRLLTGTGVFFEFVPVADFHENRLETASARALPLAAAQPGRDYVLLLTTPSGLCRYVLGDVIRLTSVDPPRLRFLGRCGLELNAAGERVYEREITEALVAVCQRHAWRIVNFHVAPFQEAGGRCRHEWWVELKPGTVETPTGPIMAPELDMELQRISETYRNRRRVDACAAPYVRLVMPGVFEQWLRTKGRWGLLQRMPRCRSDRAVADELAQLAPFSAH